MVPPLSPDCRHASATRLEMSIANRAMLATRRGVRMVEIASDRMCGLMTPGVKGGHNEDDVPDRWET
jgi:hypothetical protein